MPQTPDRPFAASDPDVAADVQRWLDRQGYAIAYGPLSARAERGDALIVGIAERATMPLAEAA